ncbi:MAG TPA: phosphoglucosamine mutase, partial [Ilumatobacteraceae bacterium]|nr:phosphoglucosamine mutase [Ilumatobacteraceae bacterium]
MLRFGTDGVRGVALTELTIDDVTALGRAAVEVLGGGTWLVGRDTRESGPELEAALVRGLCAAGASVQRLGVVPTPAVAFHAAARGLPAAMITASHNPYHDNGVKFFGAGGLKLSDAVERSIEAAAVAAVDAAAGSASALSADAVCSTDAEAGMHTDGSGAGAAYVAHITGLFPAGALTGMSVVLDCANGAMSGVAPAAVAALGADVQVIHAEPDGRNINDRCGATHTASLTAAVVAAGADAGLAFDGDGDRVIAVDATGAVVDGDRMIALGALQLHAEGALTADTVVVTVMTNLGFHRAMQEAGIHVIATAVGDRYVLEALDAGDYSIGGEQSGHVIYRHLAT